MKSETKMQKKDKKERKKRTKYKLTEKKSQA